jgi:hypothetical protein
MIGGDEPFLIYRDADGGWHCDFTQNQYGETFDWVEDAMNGDKAAFLARGQDFASDETPDLYDEVLCKRLRTEYYNVTTYDMDADHKKIYAVLNFFEDNAANFPDGMLDYLTQFDRPLDFLDKMCPFNLATGHEGWAYNKDLAPDAVEQISQRIEGIINTQKLAENPLEGDKQARCGVQAAVESGKPDDKSKRVIDGHYTEKFSVAFAGREVFLAVDETDDAPYLVCAARWDNPPGVTEYTDGEVFSDYIEAMRGFVDRVDALLITLEKERGNSAPVKKRNDLEV